MPSYEDLKKEIIVIKDLVLQFPEPLQDNAFRILISEYLGHRIPTDANAIGAELQRADSGTIKVIHQKKRTPSKDRSLVIVDDLNLNGSETMPSFARFVEEKKPESSIEFNVVSVFYLKKILGLKQITSDHIYTCYKKTGRILPERFQKNLWHTQSDKYRYITLEDNDITLTTRGENLVEHELPSAKSGKEVEAEPE